MYYLSDFLLNVIFASYRILNVLPKLPYYAIDLFIMLMPTIGYLDMVRMMIISKSSAAFNFTTVSILLLAHGLKIFYFFLNPYAINVFGQSISQFCVAIFMTFFKFKFEETTHGKSYSIVDESEESTDDFNDTSQNLKNINHIKRIKSKITKKIITADIKNYSKKISQHYSKSYNKRKNGKKGTNSNYCAQFWSSLFSVFNIYHAKTFSEFITALISIALLIFLAIQVNCYTFSEQTTIHIIGIIANLVESMISFPMFYKIVFKRTVSHISTLLVLQFVSGDMMKLCFYIYSHTPISFIAGSCLQMCIDTILFISFVQLKFLSPKLVSSTKFLISDATSESSHDVSFSTEEHFSSQENFEHEVLVPFEEEDEYEEDKFEEDECEAFIPVP
ncbi:hypothetical protein TRFO_15611 [Tritrichomonas foetus]|uniref:PQ loop repeat family protein n=1 Tax=Tritrichomonas foetus TaxID=1144522 RepID=A0A1J4KT71_9EUKA|nr:hypothetical protein TRFO_15611 [Tritrichomonas foetus]|eukprot:OHT14080.1 hypothetical protein TRFO_15611 [Tritrichomonas foetus]